jgi:acylphosphatase
MHLLIRGAVQGVGYRFHALDAARRLKVAGWVRNLPDGGVEAEAQADEDALERFVAELREGPPLSRVSGVERRVVPETGGKDFEIR